MKGAGERAEEPNLGLEGGTRESGQWGKESDLWGGTRVVGMNAASMRAVHLLTRPINKCVLSTQYSPSTLTGTRGINRALRVTEASSQQLKILNNLRYTY